MRPLDREPTSDAEVFDLLHGLFGIGDYAEDDPKPWHKMRMVEISKIKAIAKKRHLSYADFYMLATYCAGRGLPIARTWDLLQHYPAALRERSANARLRPDLVGQQIQAAIDLERMRPDGVEWVGRLSRAEGTGRASLLADWKRERA